MDAILRIKYDFHCLKIIIVLCFHYSVITSGRYDTEVINSAPIFFSHLCRAARVVEEPAEETTTSGK